jgi:4-amino-4-deoxy-L-arabinose transferase-like glycosyltransferase
MNTPGISALNEPTGWDRSQPLALSPIRIGMLALLGLTVFRLWYITRIGLVPDEAYYWLWSKHLAASYRDKGPGIAWFIALSTWLFGDNLFGVRFFAVMLSAGTGWFLLRLARRLFDDRTAVWCLTLACILPLFAVGSVVMTIDSPSLFFWAWAMDLFWTALERRSVLLWTGLGLIIGLGFLSKFTNGLQLACIGMFLLWSPQHRPLLFSRQTLALCVAFCLSTIPMVWWNIQTGWVHAAALHSRSGVETSFQIHPLELLRFLAGEIVVLTPLIGLGFGVAVLGLISKSSTDVRLKFLEAHVLPVFAVFCFFSLNKAGKENWPAPGLLAGLILTVVYWRELVARRPRWRPLVWAALGIAVLATAVLHNTDYLHLPSKREPLRRAQGWEDFARHVQEVRVRLGANLLIGNHYSQASIMQFYLPDQPTTYVPKEEYGANQFTLWPGFTVAHNTRALFVTDSMNPPPAQLEKDFSKCEIADDFWSMHHGRPMTHFRTYLCTKE